MRILKAIGAVLGTTLVVGVSVLWWAGRPPSRPRGLSSNAIHLEPNNVPFQLSKTGYWLDCWFVKSENVDRCKLTDVTGNSLFEGEFVTYNGQLPVPQRDLVLDRKTGYLWTGSSDRKIHVPVIFLSNGQILLPQKAYEEASRTVDWIMGKRTEP